jgi:hypothetical protein
LELENRNLSVFSSPVAGPAGLTVNIYY